MAVAVEHRALEADEGDQIEFAWIDAALAVVMRLLAQGGRQACLHFAGGNPPGAGLAAHQLAQGECAAASFQFGTPFVIEAPPFIERHALFGTGIGYVDAHLLMSTFLTPEATLWTRDKRLRAVAERLGVAADID